MNPRRPATFKLDDPRVVLAEAETPVPRGSVRVTLEPEPQLPAVIDDTLALPPPRGFRWSYLLGSAVGSLVLLGAGVGTASLVEDLFARNAVLGAVGAALAGLAALAFAVIAGREARALLRLSTIEHLQRRAAEILVSDDRAASRALLRDLGALAQTNPRLARARALLVAHQGDIIDGADMVRLAERELMAPLDAEARRLVSAAAQRVSLVTAISPRALVDMLFVAAAAVRLMRQLALIYGGRPGALGLIALAKHTLGHLALTGGLAASDSIVQQMLGHGVAAKLSARLGEGLLNGLLTARLGLAAIDAIRPLPFAALPRPALSDLARDLMNRDAGRPTGAARLPNSASDN